MLDRLLLWVPFIVLQIVSPADGLLRAQSVAPPLEIDQVRIVPGSISISSIVLISVRNGTAIERLVCLGAFHLTMRPVGDSYAEGGARDCQEAGQFVSIPPRATHVVRRSVLRRQDVPGASIQIGMLLFHRPGMGGPTEMVDVAWHGSVQEAEAAGRSAPAR